MIYFGHTLIGEQAGSWSGKGQLSNTTVLFLVFFRFDRGC